MHSSKIEIACEISYAYAYRFFNNSKLENEHAVTCFGIKKTLYKQPDR